VRTEENCANNYILIRTWIASDDCLNTTVHSQTIVVQDTNNPVFVENLPMNVTVECNAVPITPIVTATDNCGIAEVSYNEERIDGSCINNYTLIRTWTARDACFNETVHVQTITVQDTTDPTLVTPYPEVLTVNCDAIPAIPMLQFIDDCSQTSVTIEYSETTSNVNSNGSYSIVRTWTVYDSCENTAVFTQTITVIIADYFNELTTETQCAVDIDLEINVISLINSQFGTQPTDGTWTDVSSSGALDISNGIFTPFNLANGSYIVRYETNELNCPRIFEVTIPTRNDYPTCTVDSCVTLTIYNAITPNGDGMNESFIIENINNLDCYPENTVEIYNRWGVKVFETKNYDNTTRVFNGISEGRSTINKSSGLPSDTYYYILKYKTIEGNFVTKTGFLYLSR
jgi:gliding motility-associated-like protein